MFSFDVDWAIYIYTLLLLLLQYFPYLFYIIVKEAKKEKKREKRKPIHPYYFLFFNYIIIWVSHPYIYGVCFRTKLTFCSFRQFWLILFIWLSDISCDILYSIKRVITIMIYRDKEYFSGRVWVQLKLVKIM